MGGLCEHWSVLLAPGSLRRRDEAEEKSLARALGGVESDGAEGPEAEIYGDVADLPHERGEFGGEEEARDGFGQISVGGGIARDEPSNARQDVSVIPAENIPHKIIGRFGEL